MKRLPKTRLPENDLNASKKVGVLYEIDITVNT
jgi:hypothetical protein